MADKPRCGHPKPDGTSCRAYPKKGDTKCAAHLGLVGRKAMLGTDEGEQLQARITALLRGGNYIETACHASGVSISAFYAWRERGEADIEADVASPYREFAEAVTRARAEGEAMILQEIRTAARGSEYAPGDWKAGAWVLERTMPEKYGQRREVTHRAGVHARTEPPVCDESADRLLAVVAIAQEVGVLPGPLAPVSENGGSSNGTLH